MSLQSWLANGWLRKQAEYDRIGVVSDREAEELIAFVQELKIRVRDWLYAEYQELM